MRLLRLELVLPLVCCVACARPTLEEPEDDAGIIEVEDASQPARDAAVQPKADASEVVEPPLPKDAGPSITTPEVDAGQEQDAGDQLPSTLFDCNQGAPDISSTLDGSSVQGLFINGRTGGLARVAPGADVTISLTLSVADCGIRPASVSLGLEGASKCLPGFCVSQGINLTTPFVFTISAPVTPGWYPVLAALTETVCGTAAGVPQVKVAALCVSK